MNYSDAKTSCRSFSKEWAKPVWLCLLANGEHTIGASVKKLRAFAKQFGGCKILGKAVKGKFIGPKIKPKMLATHKSSGNPGILYHITKDSDGILACSCPGWQFRGKCWHMTEYTKRRT